MLNKLKKYNRKNWNKGSGELISMALVLPVIIFLIFTIIGVIQLGLIRQTMEYSVYLSARQAVVCEGQAEAEAAALSAAKMSLSSSTFGVDIDNVQVQLRLVGGTSGSGNEITWEKGALLECRLLVPAYAYLSREGQYYSTTIYMMVERPARTY